MGMAWAMIAEDMSPTLTWPRSGLFIFITPLMGLNLLGTLDLLILLLVYRDGPLAPSHRPTSSTFISSPSSSLMTEVLVIVPAGA
ncbi:GL19516 [Drosophila persimilis]|uniref:GL19516 n=1 Tax=Drosophila persimilis TaxID=7234 RepID=B4G9P1_DROPE|nr:GL19516 [Drosophila persimilis]